MAASLTSFKYDIEQMKPESLWLEATKHLQNQSNSKIYLQTNCKMLLKLKDIRILDKVTVFSTCKKYSVKFNAFCGLSREVVVENPLAAAGFRPTKVPKDFQA
jgi:hypothetical protein